MSIETCPKFTFIAASFKQNFSLTATIKKALMPARLPTKPAIPNFILSARLKESTEKRRINISRLSESKKQKNFWKPERALPKRVFRSALTALARLSRFSNAAPESRLLNIAGENLNEKGR
jgi:hypothetical protein